MLQTEFDAVVIGAGFGGIYQLYSLLKLGLSVRVIDAAGDVGGTWYWNRYPGAMSDTNSFIYRYSWDTDDLVNYPWPERYVKQPEVLAYLQHVVEKYDLRKHFSFNTEMRSAEFDESSNVWKIHTKESGTLTARFVVTALGLLSKRNFPDYPGVDLYNGEIYHTGTFPKDWDFRGKRVGIIGSGSTGVQIITALGKPGMVKSLTSFQRSPQYSVPSGDGPVTKEERTKINEGYKDGSVFDQVYNSLVGFGFDESTIPTMSVSEEERQRIFQENWDKGNGFRFMFGTFCDISYNREANEAACNFIKNKIKETVKDPEKARKLLPDELYARRPLCDGGYYQVFNEPHVEVVRLKETPITEFTATGIKTSDGTHHELDAIILATGFDAMDANYLRVSIKGRNGESLQDHWDKMHGPSAYIGMAVPNFPNWFMLTGPMGAFSNIPPVIDTQVQWISEIINAELQRETGDAQSDVGKKTVEARQEAEDAWHEECYKLAAGTLFTQANSWIFGANIPGKRYKGSLTWYFGGIKAYRNKLAAEKEDGYPGFENRAPLSAAA